MLFSHVIIQLSKGTLKPNHNKACGKLAFFASIRFIQKYNTKVSKKSIAALENACSQITGYSHLRSSGGFGHFQQDLNAC